jgi:aryl-alcohol dehydrogenase-like predicted oxidoreductase
METRPLGKNGPQVPVIGFGAWPIGGGMGPVEEESAKRTLHHALDSGVTLVDTAEAYRTSESVIGRALAEWSGKRDQIFLASLRALGTEYIDLLQAHSWDAQHSIEETMRAFGDLVQQGKVRYVGVSNFDVPQMERAWATLPFASLQPRYNLLDRQIEDSILPYCQRQGIGVLAHSPLAKGLLTGKYGLNHKFPEADERSNMPRFQGEQFRANLAAAGKAEAWARERGHTLVELAIAWVLAHPAMTVCLCGAKSPDQVDEHVRAAQWKLTEAERKEVAALVN